MTFGSANAGRSRRMNKKDLKIVLKSDLCVGSGYSYAGVVDSDICYDDCGLPYIPAKRLKGNLREAAELIGLTEDEIRGLFGKGGDSTFDQRGQYVQRGVYLGNAYIKNYEKIYHELKYMDKKLKKHITPQNVLEQFSVIKAQTKIMENGVAKDNSLRFIRTVKQYSPIDKGQELEFIAELDLSNLNEGDVKNLEMVVKAMRNIGLNRNRGLGSVKCSLVACSKSYTPKVDLSEITDDEDTYVMSYRVRNTAPLVLNVGNNYTTEKYISGQSVLGYFASAYLKNGNCKKDDFENIFLKDKVIFSGLYPCDEKKVVGSMQESNIDIESQVYYPAPSYINRLKKTKKYVNVSKAIPFTLEECRNHALDENYASGNGNQPKKMKGKFVFVEDFPELKIDIKEVESDIVYHHTKKQEDLLYSFEVIREQQCFAGTIVGKGKYLKQIGNLLLTEKLKFGKSKSSQYGTCELEGCAKVRKAETIAKKYASGSRILVTLQSDGIFTDGAGYTICCDKVREAIKAKLGISEPKGYNSEILYSEIESRQLVGYYSKWNLKRQAIPAVRVGSTFEFLLDNDLNIAERDMCVGERTGEGYGKILIIENNYENCCIVEKKKVIYEAMPVTYAKDICVNVLLDKMKDELNHQALNTEISIQNPSILGRITLMLTESINAYPDDPENAYRSFCKRINDIKTEDKKKTILEIKDRLICDNDKLDFEHLKYVKYVETLMKEYLKLMGTEKDETLEVEVKKLWCNYFMNILVCEKYKQKREGKK